MTFWRIGTTAQVTPRRFGVAADRCDGGLGPTGMISDRPQVPPLEPWATPSCCYIALAAACAARHGLAGALSRDIFRCALHVLQA